MGSGPLTPVRRGREHRGLRRLGLVIVALALAVAGVAAGLVFLGAHDKPGVSQAVSGPGQALPDRGDAHLAAGRRAPANPGTDPPTSGPHVPTPVTSDAATLSDDQILTALEAGNVVFLYGSPTPPSDLPAVAQSVAAGPFTPDLAAAGQAVVLARRAGTRGILALAWRHRMVASSASDPALAQFADAWLGRGAPGH